jgi:hypothetical protein
MALWHRMITITRDAVSVLACSILTVHVPVMAVDGKATRIVAIVRDREPVIDPVDGLVIMRPATSHHVTDTGDNLL